MDDFKATKISRQGAYILGQKTLLIRGKDHSILFVKLSLGCPQQNAYAVLRSYSANEC